MPLGDLGGRRRPGVGREPRSGARRAFTPELAARSPPPRAARQPFEPRERQRRSRACAARARSSVRDDLDRLQKRLEPEPAGGAREPARRQHVRRAGRVVADDGRGAPTKTVPAFRMRRASSPGPRSRARGARARTPPTGEAPRRATRTFHDRDVLISGNERATAADSASSGLSSSRLAVGAVLGLGEQVGRAAARGRRSRRRSPRPRWGRRADRSRRLDTSSFAAVTQRLPGPTILSTCAIVSVP